MMLEVRMNRAGAWTKQATERFIHSDTVVGGGVFSISFGVGSTQMVWFLPQ